MGLELAKVGEPFYQCAKSVEEAEKNTKNSGKNGITIFDRYLPWDKFSEVIRLGELIYTNLKNGAISQSFVYRLLKYTEMAEKYLEEINHNRIFKSHIKSIELITDQFMEQILQPKESHEINTNSSL
mgnify:CR=1 FL=1